MNNSVFGKTMENVDNRVDIKLVCNEEKAIELIAEPNYDCVTIFDENLIAVHMKRTKVIYNKPIYLGMSILDLSKTLMHNFHYNYIKKKYGDKANLLYTDTDSLMYEIETDDFYADIKDDVDDWFDSSDYPENHPSGIRTGVNKKVIGMFKDEACGKQIGEFVGLRSKLYSYTIAGKEHKKCKGIKKNVVEREITHDDYKECLFSDVELRRIMNDMAEEFPEEFPEVKQRRIINVIRSDKHDIYTEEIKKVALSAKDDKRITNDGINTLSYGYFNHPGTLGL